MKDLFLVDKFANILPDISLNLLTLVILNLKLFKISKNKRFQQKFNFVFIKNFSSKFELFWMNFHSDYFSNSFIANESNLNIIIDSIAKGGKLRNVGFKMIIPSRGFQKWIVRRRRRLSLHPWELAFRWSSPVHREEPPVVLPESARWRSGLSGYPFEGVWASSSVCPSVR